MNTLEIIRKKIQKLSAIHDAQIAHTTYRGVTYTNCLHDSEVHGNFCYRGNNYNK